MKPRIWRRGSLWQCEWCGYNALGVSVKSAYWNLDEYVRQHGKRLPREKS